MSGWKKTKISHAEWAQIKRLIAKSNGQIKPPDPFEPRAPLAFSYRRCSHQDSADTRLGLDTQTRAVEAWYQVVNAEHPGVGWSEFFEDAAVSAHKRRFFDRPEGSKLNSRLRKGDHVIFAKFDRAFRNLRDCFDTLAD